MKRDNMDSEAETFGETQFKRIQRSKEFMRRITGSSLKEDDAQIKPLQAGSLILAASLGAVILLFMFTLYSYNKFVELNENVKTAAALVDVAIQRRANLFANLVKITLNHAALEESVFEHVAETRSKTGEMVPPGLAAEADKLKQPLTAALEAQGPLARLMAVAEQYPDIKSAHTYRQLMENMVEIESRIGMRRDEYNNTVRTYNQRVSSFPWIFLAKLAGFKTYNYFKASDDILNTPAITHKMYEKLWPGRDAVKSVPVESPER